MENVIRLKELKDKFIEKNGKFQIILITLLAFNSIVAGINHTITSFHVYTPKFYCRDQVNLTCGVFVNGTECPSGYEFNENDDNTVAVEWSLVCNRHFIAPLINTLYFVGVTIGSLVCTTLSDLFGRKKIVLTCMYTQALISIGIYFCNSLELFVALRLFQGLFVQGLQTCSYTLMMEYCPSRHRTGASIFWGLNWSFGLAVLGGTSYFIREWRLLTLFLITPTVLSLLYCWMISESLSWLHTNQQYKECFQILKRMSKVNGDKQISAECKHLKEDFDKNPVNYLEMTCSKEEDIVRRKHIVFDLVRSKVLRRHLSILVGVWFVVTVCYYQLLYFLPNLAGQRHVNFLIGAAVEAMSYIIAYFVFSKFGRRVTVAFYQILNGMFLIAIGLLSLMEDGTSKGCSVSSFAGMFMFSCELFPTICRGIALGLCAFASRCASLLTPQFMILFLHLPVYVPMFIIAGLVILTGISTLWLPETVSISLPHTIEEAETVYRKQSIKSGQIIDKCETKFLKS